MLSQDVEDRLGRLEARLSHATAEEIRALQESWAINYLGFRVDEHRAEARLALGAAPSDPLLFIAAAADAPGLATVPPAVRAVQDAVLGLVACDLVPSLTFRVLTWPVFEVFGRCWEDT